VQYSDNSSLEHGQFHAHKNPFQPNTSLSLSLSLLSNHGVTRTFRCRLGGICYFPDWSGTRSEDAKNQETAYQVANQVANQEAGDQGAPLQGANQEAAHQGANQEPALQGANQEAMPEKVSFPWCEARDVLIKCR
jgi:hypothetical protein